MRALFYVEPLILHNRPFHYWSLLGHFADMAHALRSVGWEVRVVVNEALAVRATAPRGVGSHYARLGQGLPEEEVVVLLQEPIRRLFALPNAAILEGMHRGRVPRAAVERYASLVRAALGDFVPDVMVALAPADQLRLAYPDAMLLGCDVAAYSRPPFSKCFFLDPEGLWDRSVPAVHAAALLEREPTPGERALLAAFRERFLGYFRAVSPLGQLEEQLRAKYRLIGLLPLQFGGEPGFDCNGPFRNQGEYLFHVLEQLPSDVALVVVEHPTAYWLGDIIDEETRELLAARYPHVHFVDYRATPSAGQVLLAHVDFAISVSSSIGLQALLFGKPLVSVGTSHLAELATVRGMENFPAELPAPDARVDRALCWLMSHYFPPLELCKQGEWMSSYLRRGVERWRAGRRGLDFFEPIASDEELARHLFAILDRQSATPLRGRLENGDFSACGRGPGPFWIGGEGPDCWHLLDYGGGIADARMTDGPAIAVQRYQAGTLPTFLLQRIPDAASCAGSMARMRFRARSAMRSTLTTYLYAQIADGQPCTGSDARPFVLGPEWQTFEYVGYVPPLAGREPGPGSHVEVVFALMPEAGAASFELADVSLEPAAF